MCNIIIISMYCYLVKAKMGVVLLQTQMELGDGIKTELIMTE